MSIEIIFYFSCFNAFMMKLLSKGGYFYKPAKRVRIWFVELFDEPFQRTVDKLSKCVACRFMWVGLMELYLYLIWNGLPSLSVLMLGAPFAIGILSTISYTFINPRHEEN